MKKIRHIWGQNSEIEENCDVDVKPVMNMFIILIPFLVSMAVFSNIAMHQFYLPPDAANSDMSGEIVLRTTVVIDVNYVLLTVGSEVLDSMSIEDFERERLISALTAARETSDAPDKAIVAVRDDVLFDWVVRIMDICRASGFSQTGLSSAPASATLGMEQ
ncbi:MAG: biopolymer transporter ExbD [Chitinivibrionia bacterium]|nr:biopolymer transporter ExbD [Chitinivibrionia bacterium]